MRKDGIESYREAVSYICYISGISATVQLVVIPFLKRANSFTGFAFLLFYGIYDICNQNEMVSGCVYGKMYETASR